jgi:formylglycine-generating enzyme required for sulfatase activity
MTGHKRTSRRKKGWILFLLGIIVAIVLSYPFNNAVSYTSTNEYCISCHVHDHAVDSWRLSPHVDNDAGIVVNCVDCHLPPEGHGYIAAKIKHGTKDLYGFYFKDSADYKWDEKRTTEFANEFTYEESCKKCHSNLYPAGLSKKGVDSHIHYEQADEDMTCLNCHMHTGHFDPNYKHAQNTEFSKEEEEKEVFTEPAEVTEFKDFEEKIPGTSVAFKMKAVPGGEFVLGSPKNEPFRNKDEGPQRKVRISPFFMAEVEVTWDEFLAWFSQTSSEGRKDDEKSHDEIDAMTGATPPWGAPDQGWGKGKRPAITMSHFAATQYCRWLSKVTGKKYRLPTETEWEYAARGGTSTPYFFEGSPKDYSDLTFWNKWFGPDTAIINSYVIYKENSRGKTQLPDRVKPNPFGLKNMLGNVAEFCSDWYAPNTYATYKDGITDPKGPARGKEHVVRGGSYRSDASLLRCATREYSHTKDWLKTDPQIPKSRWWYSDQNFVGFRVVCEPDSGIVK